MPWIAWHHGWHGLGRDPLRNGRDQVPARASASNIRPENRGEAVHARGPRNDDGAISGPRMGNRPVATLPRVGAATR
jgi:hypothetical protein